MKPPAKHELIHQLARAREELRKHQEFFMAGMAISFDGCDWDGSDIQAKAIELGLAKVGPGDDFIAIEYVDLDEVERPGIHPKLTRGMVWCKCCGRSQKVDSAACLSDGWPKCHGETMTIDSPEERQKAAGGS